jgi:hypothetical protein
MNKKIYYEMPPRKRGYERHHIIPKHMGGTDADGVVYLTQEEHAEAHRLLYAEHNKLQDKWAVNIIMEENIYEQCGENNPMWRVKVSEEVKEKQRQAMLKIWQTTRKGWKQTEEAKKNLSEKAKERFVNKENHPMYGKSLSEETKKKISEGNTGKKHTEETKKLMSKQRSGPNGQNVRSGISFAPIEERRKHRAAMEKKRRNATDATREAYNKYMREFNAKQKQKNQGQGTLEVLFG